MPTKKQTKKSQQVRQAAGPVLDVSMPDLGNAARDKAWATDTEGADVEQHDLGPWIETPSSTRVSRFRFDHLTRQLQVQWTNGKGPGYVYDGVDYEGYRAFARVVSKGKHINAVLNGHDKRPMEGEELLPSNEQRRGIGSRLRT
jgi:KTSC domain